MRKTAASLALAFLFVFRPIPVLAAAGSMDWSDVVQKALPAVVNISVQTLTTDPKTGRLRRQGLMGSGFFIDTKGTIVTNRHVVEGAFSITVTTSDKLQWKARLIAAGKLIDLAVLKIDAGRATPFLEFASSDAVQVGDPLLVIGNPAGLGTAVSAGIVSALNRNLSDTPFDDYIQTDAAINHGNSGGPVLDRDGHVVGIATILLTSSEGSNGLGFAIPSTDASYAVRHLLDPKGPTVGWIGVHLQDVSADLARAFGFAEPQGFLITQIDPGSPAAKAGLRDGDIILRFLDGAPADSRALMREIVLTPLGTVVPMVIERRGQVMTQWVTVEAWPNLREEVSSLTTTPELAAEAQPPDLGLLLTPMTGAADRLYDLKGKQGVVITGVDPASEAYTRGIEPGDVIEQVEDAPVSTVDDVMRRVEQAEAQHRFVAFLIDGKSGARWVALYATAKPSAAAKGATAAEPKAASAAQASQAH